MLREHTCPKPPRPIPSLECKTPFPTPFLGESLISESLAPPGGAFKAFGGLRLYHVCLELQRLGLGHFLKLSNWQAFRVGGDYHALWCVEFAILNPASNLST